MQAARVRSSVAIATLTLCWSLLPAIAHAQADSPSGQPPIPLHLTQAFEEALPLAVRGDPLAQHRLGQMYEQGQGVVQSDTEAADWYRRSAEQGYAPAQARLGDLFKAGQGVARSDMEAVSWYRRAAEQGDASAQNSLAAMLYEGRGVLQDKAEARAWWQKAADQDDAVAKVVLAQLPPDDTPLPGTAPSDTAAPAEACADLDNGVAVQLKISGYPQPFVAMVLSTANDRAAVQVMDPSAPPSAAGRRLSVACRLLVRAE